ncbi:MAG: hypothetical protein J6M20_09050 [Clostridia bacterium]|nr:hypothetical protein [Clostridia bacterium]
MAEQRPCRCLLMASGQEDMARLVAEYIATLPEESRVSDESYHARLALCESCEALHSGTCARCGCYVEARAAKRSLSCPATPPVWVAE